MMEKLSDIGEDALIDRLTEGLQHGPGVIAGPGDDCAVLAGPEDWMFELLKTDCVVEGVHFERGTDPESVGWKALCRALSDLAAMGGTPRCALITIVSPGDRAVGEIEGWYRGIRSAAEEYSVDLVGGETSSLPAGTASAVISVAVRGWVEKIHCAYRSGAEIGDQIAVTGRLGGSLKSGRHLSFRPRLEQGRWLAGGFTGLTSMMDLSDGLAKDLPRLAKASSVGFRLEPGAIPRNPGCSLDEAVGDGEDYELLFTLESGEAESAFRDWRIKFPEIPITVIGEITETIETPFEGGWEHFSKGNLR